MDHDTHQISRRRCDSSLDLSHITRTTRPSSLASGPGSGPGSVCVDVGVASTIVLISIDRPRHPAFWHFAGVGVDGGNFDGFGACTRTFVTKSASYRAPIANACCFAPGNVDVDIIAEREAREDVDVREVAVPCERMEKRSETEVCAEGGRERGRGGYGYGMAMAVAEGGVGGSGGTRRVFVSGREELLAEGVRARAGEFTPEAKGEGVGPCEAKLPAETRGWETERWGSLGGWDEGGEGGEGGLVTSGGGFWGRSERAMGGKEESAEDVSEGLV